MPTLTEQMERFQAIEEVLEEDRRNYNNLEARFTVQKEQYMQKKKELAEKGIQYKTGKELQEIYREKKEKVESILTEMENALGIVEGDDDVEDELDF